jgi:peptidoglycan hydrolase-like amidase
MNPTWHLEALKAQAVAARTYAYQKMQSQSISKRENIDLPYEKRGVKRSR